MQQIQCRKCHSLDASPYRGLGGETIALPIGDAFTVLTIQTGNAISARSFRISFVMFPYFVSSIFRSLRNRVSSSATVSFAD